MSLPLPKHPGYTLDDWRTWEGRWELINGVAYDMTPAPNLEHQRVSFRLGNMIFNALEAGKNQSGGECEAFAAPVDVFLGETVVQPDLVVVCDPAKKSERGIEGAPDLFQTIYLDVLAKRKNRRVLSKALDAIDGYLDEHYQAHLKPLLAYLKKENRLVPLSEMSDHFAFSQLYPWHLESACEWLERKGLLQKLSAPFKLTKRSTERVEEPAYLLDT